MSELRKAAQQALEALEGWDNHDKWVWPESALEQAKRNTKEAIPALRAALAEPDYWQEEARRYAGNADYWRKRHEAIAEPEQISNARCPRCWEPITAPTPRKPDLEALNAELVEALREIEWSNDTRWQRDRARAALAKVDAAIGSRT